MSDFKRINIYENDLTTNATDEQDTDIVYVPGFAVTAKASVGARIPTLCRTVAQFETAFGAEAPKFATAQIYPVAGDITNGIQLSTGTYAGFIPNGIPDPQQSQSTTQMFAANACDPAYIYAKELLAAGIPVVYERINADDTEITIATMYKRMLEGYSGYFAIYATDLGANLIAQEVSIKYITSGGYPTFEFTNGQYDSNTETFTVTSASTKEYTLSNSSASTVTKVTINDVEKTLTTDYTFNSTTKKVTFTNAVTLAVDDVIVVTYNTTLSQSNSICTNMMLLAKTRGDATAFIDHTDNPDRSLLPNAAGGDDTPPSVYYAATNENSASVLSGPNSSFGTMFTPWMNTNLAYTYNGNSSAILPGSFQYFKCLAKSIKNNPNWLAISGVGRGLVPDVSSAHITKVLTNAIAESYQVDPGNAEQVGISINPITNIRPYGQCIWGNRTLSTMNANRTEFATNFLNIRNLVSDVKKQAFLAAQSLMFEQNNDVLWVNFKALLTPMLDRMKSGYGISAYKIIKGNPADKTKLEAEIKIYPIYPLESVDIYVTLSDEEVSVE